MSAYSELRERVERATGPDRELDCLLWAEFDNRDAFWEDNNLLARYRKPPHDTCWLGWTDPGRRLRNFSICKGFDPPIPKFTASIDAALALVERVAGANVEEIVQRALDLLNERGVWPFSRWMPLAILSALLRAIEKDHEASSA